MKSSVLNLLFATLVISPVYAQTNSEKKEKAGPGNVIQNTVMIDSLKKDESIQDIARKVVESTYKNFPQQPGQSTIIINNIIMPSDFNRSQPSVAAPAPVVTAAPVPAASPSDDPEFQEWLRDRYRRKALEASMVQSESVAKGQGQQMSFKDRFGELPPRKSGTWVIPTVGIHASGFEADFKDEKFAGRTGWNAGVDIRMRANRFFVQPGVHYFNSSMKVTEKDSISNAPVLDGPRIHSVKVPLMLGLYLTKANSGFFKFNVKGGATANYLIDVDKNDQSDFTKDNLEDFYYGLNAGIGLEFGLVALDISHEWGITDYFKNSNQKNNILRVTLGIKL